MTQQVANSLISFYGGSFGFRNKLYNGSMRQVQRATTYALTTSWAWGSVDRWAFVQASAEYDDEGNLVRPAGNRYGVRYDELLAFIIGGS